MIFTYLRFLMSTLTLCVASIAFATPTHQEIIDELAGIRETTPQLQWDMQFKPFERYYQDRIDEAKILDAMCESDSIASTYITFKVTALLVRLGVGDMVLLTPDNAPKTYEFVAEIAEKVGLEETPWIYLVSDPGLFNAFASGFSHSTALVGLGERLIQETPDSQALEFLIAHELSHIKCYHMAKTMALTLPLGLTSAAYDIYVRHQTYKGEDGSSLWLPRSWTLQELSISWGLRLTTALLFAWQSRMHEREADMTAAHAVGSQGGVELMKLFKNMEMEAQDQQARAEETKARENPPTRLEKIRKKLNDWIEAASVIYHTHPSHDERIAYLTELLKQQESEAVAHPAQA